MKKLQYIVTVEVGKTYENAVVYRRVRDLIFDGKFYSANVVPFIPAEDNEWVGDMVLLPKEMLIYFLDKSNKKNKEALDILRSTYQIAARKGVKTNWKAFTSRVGAVIDKLLHKGE